MKRELVLNDGIIAYDVHYKNVKNINLRVKRDGTVHVSANESVHLKVIDEFVASKAEFIQKAVNECERMNNLRQTQYFAEEEICNVIFAICKKVYPYFEKSGVKSPLIKFRKMKSRWGSCHPQKCVLTFNTNLMYAPIECIEYVVLHEFTHFLQANHSVKFYDELSKVCPDWKERRKRLKEINIR